RPLSVARHQYLALASEMQEGGAALENGDAVVFEKRHLAERLAGKMLRTALVEGNGADFILKPRFLARPAQPDIADITARTAFSSRNPVIGPDDQRFGHFRFYPVGSSVSFEMGGCNPSCAVQMQDVAVGIFKPNHLEPAGLVDAVLVGYASHLILFKFHAFGAQIGGDDIYLRPAVPDHGVSLVGAGKFGRIDDEMGRACPVDQHSLHVLLHEFEPKRIAIEAPRPFDVAHRDDGRRSLFSKCTHRNLSCYQHS